MHMEKADVLIIGQGLAGSLMAFSFLKRGKSVMVVNQTDKSCSSYVAAGLYNPVTGKKRSKTWKADLLFPFLEKYYKEMEAYCGIRFLYPLPIYKPFSSIQDQNHWYSYTADHDVNTLTEEAGPNTKYSTDVNNEHGGFATRCSGFVDLPSLMDNFRAKLKTINAYRETWFDPADLIAQSDGTYLWQDLKVSAVVACQGIKALENSLFEKLPLVPNKGEVLALEVNMDQKEVIYNSGVFIMPRPDGLYKAGSTYKRNENDTQITTEAREDIEERIKGLLKKPYQVKDQTAGVRPTVGDRRPAIGKHLQLQAVYVFNGLGTKGVSLGPYFAEQLTESILNGGAIDKEVNWERLKKK